jgi:hypothetical protein
MVLHFYLDGDFLAVTIQKRQFTNELTFLALRNGDYLMVTKHFGSTGTASSLFG